MHHLCGPSPWTTSVLNSIHGFGLVRKEKQHLKGMGGEVGRKWSPSYAACFGLLYCAKIDTKMVAWQMREEKEMHND